jgi:hypothetical protein
MAYALKTTSRMASKSTDEIDEKLLLSRRGAPIWLRREFLEGSRY